MCNKEELPVAPGFPASLIHSWSQIRDWVNTDACTLPRQTVWKIECSGPERDETYELLTAKGFLVEKEGPCCTIDWEDPNFQESKQQVHNYLAFCLPPPGEIKLLESEVDHLTYKEEFSAHNCLVKRRRLTESMGVKDKLPQMKRPDDRVVENCVSLSDKTNRPGEEKLMARFQSNLEKQIQAWRKSKFKDVTLEVSLQGVEADVIHRLLKWMAQLDLNCELASFRQLGIPGLRKVARIFPQGESGKLCQGDHTLSLEDIDDIPYIGRYRKICYLCNYMGPIQYSSSFM